MDRKDLVHARRIVPDLNRRWRDRRAMMQMRLENAWARLDASNAKQRGRGHQNAPYIYQEIARTDRVLSFLDRALVHLDDIEHGTTHLEGMPIRPAASPNERPRSG